MYYRGAQAALVVYDLTNPESLRRAKLRMMDSFGPQAVPRLWSGVLAYGDAAATVAPKTTPTHGGTYR